MLWLLLRFSWMQWDAGSPLQVSSGSPYSCEEAMTCQRVCHRFSSQPVPNWHPNWLRQGPHCGAGLSGPAVARAQFAQVGGCTEPNWKQFMIYLSPYSWPIGCNALMVHAILWLKTMYVDTMTVGCLFNPPFTLHRCFLNPFFTVHFF